MQINAQQGIARPDQAMGEKQVRTMTSCECWFFNPTAPQPALKFLYEETDAEALRRVSIVLRASPDIERVEVWRDSDFAFRINQHQIRLEKCAGKG